MIGVKGDGAGDLEGLLSCVEILTTGVLPCKAPKLSDGR